MRFLAASLILLALQAQTPSAPLHEQGVQRFRAHDYTGAIDLLQRASQSEAKGTPQFAESMIMIGQSYFMLSQVQKAIPYLQQVAGMTDADYMLGYAYIENAQPDLSEMAFARLFQLDPKSAQGHLLAGQMLIKKEFETEAEAELLKAAALQPSLPEANFLLGEIALYRGRVEDGINYLHKELALNPNFSMAWYRLGDAYSRQQAWGLAIPNLERAIWLNTNFSGPYLLLGKCYLRQKNYDNAEGILRKGLELDPQNAAGNYLLGQALLAEGKTEEARAQMEKVKSLHAQ